MIAFENIVGNGAFLLLRVNAPFPTMFSK